MKPGRIFAAVAIVAMTLLTFASCGPLKFKGIDLARNQMDKEDFAESMMTGLGMGSVKVTKPEESESKKIFEGSDSWLHFVYLGALGVAVLVLLLGVRLHGGLGILGLALTLVFMFGFDSWFGRQEMEGSGASPSSSSSSSLEMPGLSPELDWEIGAWLTLAAFAAVAVAGFKLSGGGGGNGAGGGGGDAGSG